MIISEMAIPAHTIVGALNLDTSFKNLLDELN